MAKKRTVIRLLNIAVGLTTLGAVCVVPANASAGAAHAQSPPARTRPAAAQVSTSTYYFAVTKLDFSASGTMQPWDYLLCSSVGPVSSTYKIQETYNGKPLPSNVTNALVRYGKVWSGYIAGPSDYKVTGTDSGCQGDPPQPCKTSGVTSAPRSAVGIGVGGPFNSASDDLRIQWPVPGYFFGADAGSFACNVPEESIGPSAAAFMQQVPVKFFTSPDPKSLKFVRNDTLTIPAAGPNPAITVDSSVSYSMRIVPCERTQTGRGYDTLNPKMKTALAALYGTLDGEQACYHFTIGSRNLDEQKDLYDRWHQLVDHHPDVDWCPDGKPGPALRAAHLSNCPKGWNKEGIALGGPSKPGDSRHNVDEGADISVWWPPNYDKAGDWERFRAAAAPAGLCGPSEKDQVHVELPYKKGKDKEPRCHFT